MKNIGCTYFVIGSHEYLKKCVISANSLKKHMPWIETKLYTDLCTKKDCFDKIVKTDSIKKRFIWQYKYDALLDSDYECNLHLDSDTYITTKFPEVFTMLDRFEIVFPLSPHYIRTNKKIPDCFPEPSGGFIVWKNTDRVKKFFEDVKAATIRKRGTDEKFIRWFLYHSDINFALIPWEYNCVYAHPGYLCGEVKVMHGKRDSIIKDAEIFNRKVYEGFQAFKRVFTGKEMIFFKKIDGTAGTKMEIVDRVEYSDVDWVMAKGAG